MTTVLKYVSFYLELLVYGCVSFQNRSCYDQHHQRTCIKVKMILNVIITELMSYHVNPLK
jgi:hypothetical protein